ALLLGLEDLPVQALGTVGPGLDHLLEQVGGTDGVAAGLREEVEEDTILGREAEADHGSQYRSVRGAVATLKGGNAANGGFAAEFSRRGARRRRGRGARPRGHPREGADPDGVTAPRLRA